MAKSLFTTPLRGFLHGALLYGTVVSVLHVVHNRLDSPRDAAVLWLACLLMYGVWCAVVLAIGEGLATGWRALRHERAGRLGDGVFVGLMLFGLGFWELYFLHGLTYDQYPFGKIDSVGPMLAFLAGYAALIAAGVWLVTRFVLAPATSRSGRRIAAAALLVGGLAHGAALISDRPAKASAAPPAGAAARPAAAAQDLGLDVVLVGLDGADWRVIDPLLQKGELPHFAALIGRGVHGPLKSFPDSNSAVLWSSIYTGTRPEVHGILDFYRIRIPGMAGRGVFPVHRTFFKELADRLGFLGVDWRTAGRSSLHVPPIWEVADHLGIELDVVDGYYPSFPAPILSTPGSVFASYGLDGFAQQLAQGASAARAADLDLFLRPPGLYRDIRPLLQRDDFDWQSAVLLQLLATRGQPRFVNIYAHEPDTVQHLFWKWFQPQYFLDVKAADVRTKGDEIPKRYRSFDTFLGELEQHTGPNTVILIVSDHGHSPTILHQDFYTQHRHGPPGILLAAGGPLRRGVTVDSAGVLDVFPTVLYLLGAPIPDDAAGHLLAEMIDPAFLAAHPPRRIDSYAGRWAAEQRDVSSGLEHEEIEKLRALGYIGP